MNKVILIGRLTHDPEMRYTATGIPVMNASIAVDSGYGDNKKTDFFDLTAWRGTGETIKKYCEKGAKLMVEGEIHNSKWTDEHGNNRTRTSVTVTNFEFLGSAKNRAADTEPTIQEFEELEDDAKLPF